MLLIDLATQQLRNTNIQAISDFVNSWQLYFDAVKSDLAKTNSQMAKYADKHRQDVELNVDDLVYVLTEHLPLARQFSYKLAPHCIGPFTISSVISPDTFRVQMPAEHGWVHPIFYISYL